MKMNNSLRKDTNMQYVTGETLSCTRDCVKLNDIEPRRHERQNTYSKITGKNHMWIPTYG